jgi:hypothetical protein
LVNNLLLRLALKALFLVLTLVWLCDFSLIALWWKLDWIEICVCWFLDECSLCFSRFECLIYFSVISFMFCVNFQLCFCISLNLCLGLFSGQTLVFGSVHDWTCWLSLVVLNFETSCMLLITLFYLLVLWIQRCLILIIWFVRTKRNMF